MSFQQPNRPQTAPEPTADELRSGAHIRVKIEHAGDEKSPTGDTRLALHSGQQDSLRYVEVFDSSRWWNGQTAPCVVHVNAWTTTEPAGMSDVSLSLAREDAIRFANAILRVCEADACD